MKKISATTKTLTPESWLLAGVPGLAKTMEIPRRANTAMIKSASPECRACLAAGIEMETTSERRAKGGAHQITMTTRYPVTFTRDEGGAITRVTVHERPDPP